MSEAPPSLEVVTRAAVDAIGPLLAQLKREQADADAKASERIAAMEVEVRQLRERAARDGKDGRDGRDGQDFDFAESEAYPRFVALEAEVRRLSDQEAAQPRDGKDGRDGRDGRDLDFAESEAYPRFVALEAEVHQLRERAAATPRDGKDGRDGRDGRDGHDATFREPVDYEPEKGYPQGTIVRHRGGIWYAARAVNAAPGVPEAGWTLIVAGLVAMKVEQQEDARGFAVELELSDGKRERFAFVLPALVYRGVWKAGSYGVGDAVTWDGSLWIARRATDQKPGPVERGTEGWQLAVKKGTDGKNGAPGSDAPAFRGNYDPRERYPANAIVRTASGLWLTRRPTEAPPPADAREAENADWRCFLPMVAQ